MTMFEDKLACAEVIQTWGFCRDQSRWSELLDTFTPDGTITVSWFSGPFTQFVERCKAAVGAGQHSKHHIWPSIIRVNDDRATAETSIVIHVRQAISGAPIDISSHARFLDRLERRGGRWAIRERVAIYERDRLDPVEPSPAFEALFEDTDFASYPEQYRYMAARLKAAGRALAPVIHRDGAPETAELYARYADWLTRT
jgi:SnoaL-like protein